MYTLDHPSTNWIIFSSSEKVLELSLPLSLPLALLLGMLSAKRENRRYRRETIY